MAKLYPGTIHKLVRPNNLSGLALAVEFIRCSNCLNATMGVQGGDDDVAPS